MLPFVWLASKSKTGRNVVAGVIRPRGKTLLLTCVATLCSFPSDSRRYLSSAQIAPNPRSLVKSL